jgi:hypothetical protein
LFEAIELGVRGFLLKSAATELLIDGTVMSGPSWEQTKTVPAFHQFLRTKHEELAKRKFGLTPCLRVGFLAFTVMMMRQPRRRKTVNLAQKLGIVVQNSEWRSSTECSLPVVKS